MGLGGPIRLLENHRGVRHDSQKQQDLEDPDEGDLQSIGQQIQDMRETE
jgi:hypothetical protein